MPKNATTVLTLFFRRSSELHSFLVSSDGTAEAPVKLSAPQPLSPVSAVGTQGLAVLTEDLQSICFSGLCASHRGHEGTAAHFMIQ